MSNNKVGLPRALGPQRGQDIGGRFHAVDGYGTRGRAQGRRDRLLGPVGHRQQRRQRPQHPGEPARLGQQHRRRVRAPGHRLGQRVGPGPQPGQVAAGRVLGLAQPGHRGRRLFQARGRALARGREIGSPFLTPRDQLLELLEFLLSRLRPRAGLVQRLAQPPGLALGRGRLARRRLGLAAQPGQPLGALGALPGLRGDPALDVGDRGLRRRAAGYGVGQLIAGLSLALAELFLLRPQLRGLRVQGVGVPARPQRLGGRQVPVPLAGQAGYPAQPLSQRGQGKERLLGLGQPGRVVLVVRLQLRLARTGLAQGRLQAGSGLRLGRLVGLVPLQLGRKRHVVVGQQPQAGVPQVSLDHRGLAGDLRLPAQRLQPAAKLAGQVHEPGQVGLHGVELAERLLLAPPVLEHPGGLLDQRPAGLRPGVQHVVELALADHDVHLPAQPGVRQQFLDVEQAAVVPVDGVLALPGPEQQAADRHLGVVDGQGAVGVVDGQRDLGPAQRGTPGGAGEDHVLHLAAAQRLGSLLAHDPGERVHHVGLARPVRAHDAGDAGLEAQRGRRGERLEATQGESLQVHPRTPPQLLLLGPPLDCDPPSLRPSLRPVGGAAWLSRTLPRDTVSAADCAAQRGQRRPHEDIS